MAARILTDSTKFEHITPLLKDLGWFSVEKQLQVRDVFTQLSANVSNYVRNYVHDQKLTINKTRYNDHLDLPLCRTLVAQRSFFYHAVKTYNTLSAKTKNSINIREFKRYAMQELGRDYKTMHFNYLSSISFLVSIF